MNETSKACSKVVVLGAGSIGCYIGGCLTASGINTTLIGRERIQQQLSEHGMHLTDWSGRDQKIAPNKLDFSLSASDLSVANYIIVTVKSGDTADAARSIGEHAKKTAVIISFQNGIRNVEVLNNLLPDFKILKGMVPFNVLSKGEGRFHCGTEGNLAIEDKYSVAISFVEMLEKCNLPVDTYNDLSGVQWSKLLMNLNNSVNALSGLPLREQLQDAKYRRVLAMAMKEALSVLKATDIKLVKTGKVIPSLLPFILSLPNGLFKLVAASMLKIDPSARSSMYEDLTLGRKTEIDFINGEIVQLGKQMNISTPTNLVITQLIKAAEQAQQGSPEMSSSKLYNALGSS